MVVVGSVVGVLDGTAASGVLVDVAVLDGALPGGAVLDGALPGGGTTALDGGRVVLVGIGGNTVVVGKTVATTVGNTVAGVVVGGTAVVEPPATVVVVACGSVVVVAFATIVVDVGRATGTCVGGTPVVVVVGMRTAPPSLRAGVAATPIVAVTTTKETMARQTAFDL